VQVGNQLHKPIFTLFITLSVVADMLRHSKVTGGAAVTLSAPFNWFAELNCAQLPPAAPGPPCAHEAGGKTGVGA